MNRENRFEEFRGRKRKEELIIVHRILSWKEHGGYVSNFREVNSRHHLVEQSGLMGREIRQGSKVVAFERIRRKHSAEQEDRCGILYQQLVAGHLRRDGGSFGVSADAAKAALAFYEYIYIYIYRGRNHHELGYSWFWRGRDRLPVVPTWDSRSMIINRHILRRLRNRETCQLPNYRERFGWIIHRNFHRNISSFGSLMDRERILFFVISSWR